jgi:hypothetical protein
MSCTSDIGNYGELNIARQFLSAAGFERIERLRVNHPWADFRARRPGEGACLVSVKTRVRWERPISPSNWSWSRRCSWTENKRYRSKGMAELQLAQAENPGRPIWVAIAMDLDQTWQGWWGYQGEMCNAGLEDLWAIDLRPAARLRYERDGRSQQGTHRFDWLTHPDHWAAVAHRSWLENR